MYKNIPGITIWKWLVTSLEAISCYLNSFAADRGYEKFDTLNLELV